MPSEDWSPAPKAVAKPRPETGNDARRGGLGVVILLVIGVATGYLAITGPLHPGDNVASSETQRRNDSFLAMPPIQLQAVQPAERPQAVAAMKLPQNSQSSLQEDVSSDRTKLVWISLFDADAEDGDAVRVETDGFRQEVVLRKTPVRLAVPLRSASTIRLTGTIDGEGGGVTPGIVTPAGPMPLPILSVGQTIVIPIVIP